MAAAVLIALQATAVAQFGGGIAGGQGGMGGMQGGMGGMQGGMGQGGMGQGGVGQGGGRAGGQAGVMVDAQGVLRSQSAAGAGLTAERRKAAVEALAGDLRKSSPLRKVALSRLEAELGRAAAGGRGIPDEIEKLAGLTRIQYVFIYPAEGDRQGEIVLAGPAEPWIDDPLGRTLGVETGSPTLMLRDLATAIRGFAPGQPADRIIGCSIDPRPEGLAALKDLLRRVGKVNPEMSVDQLVTGMKNALGPQVVTVLGVPATTHFARVMVEADYRMKLIGIGLEPVPAKKMQSWVELAAAAGGIGADALKRWYFVPDYQCVRMAEDDLAIELVGRGVKLCNADEVVQPDGTRLSTTRADRASRTFTENFTRKYAEIAARNAVYGQLRNLIDLAIVAAYMQEHDAYGRAGWGAEKLRDEKVYAVETLVAPREVETAINAVWRQSRLLTPIGGGVTVQPRMAISPENLLEDEKGAVAAARAHAGDLPPGAWFWD